MKSFLFLFVILALSNVVLVESFALQQVAGKITVEIKPGETKTFDWTLVSDNDKQTSISISAEGKGSEFLSYERNLVLEPSGSSAVQFTVTIPLDYPGGMELTPNLFATEFGEKGGTTVLNIQMLKIPSIVIAPNDNPEFRINQESKMNTSDITIETIDSEPITPESEESKQPGGLIIQPTQSQPICGTGTVEKDGKCVVEKKTSESKGGGCLIATATYGSELALQVQQLRELRDNSLLQTESGKSFMNTFNDFYYSFSPTVADWERENPAFKEFVKITLTPMISSLSILNYVDIDSESSVLGYGLSLIILNVGMYFVAPVVVIVGIKKKFNSN